MKFISTDLTRILATVFLFSMVMGALALVGYDIVTGMPVNTFAASVIASAVSASLPIVGFHTGANVVNGTVSAAVKASVDANQATVKSTVDAMTQSTNPLPPQEKHDA